MRWSLHHHAPMGPKSAVLTIRTLMAMGIGWFINDVRLQTNFTYRRPTGYGDASRTLIPNLPGIVVLTNQSRARRLSPLIRSKMLSPVCLRSIARKGKTPIVLKSATPRLKRSPRKRGKPFDEQTKQNSKIKLNVSPTSVFGRTVGLT